MDVLILIKAAILKHLYRSHEFQVQVDQMKSKKKSEYWI